MGWGTSGIGPMGVGKVKRTEFVSECSLSLRFNLELALGGGSVGQSPTPRAEARDGGGETAPLGSFGNFTSRRAGAECATSSPPEQARPQKLATCS